MGNSIARQSTIWNSLVESARRGDDDAFGQICDRMTEYLLLTTRKLENGLSAKFGASDIVQQTLLEARRDIGAFHGESENDLQVWLVQLVRNNLIDTTRRYRNTVKRDISRESLKHMDGLVDDFPGPEKTASSIFRHQETDDQMLRALASLPVKWRRVVELRLWQELPYAEIGNQLNISNATARKIMERALEKLRKKLSADDHDRPIQTR
jgi:RNA polymerase sigma-70 factor, ECF subfamily